MKKTIEWGEEYVHKKSGNSYFPLNPVKIQENGVWIDAVLYSPSAGLEDDFLYFVRSEKEFLEKFELVTIKKK